MISFLIKYKTSILIVTLAFFIGSIAYLGLDSFRRGHFSSNAAQVGSEPITYRAVYRAAETQARALRNAGVDMDENLTKALNQQVLSSLISEEVLNQSAKEYGMAVADYEVAFDIQSSPQFNQNGRFDKTAYEYAVRRQLGVTPAQFEEQIRRAKLADRFRMGLYSFYKLTPEEVRFAYQTQKGNMKDFDKNKKDFERELFQSKMDSAQQAFFDDFNNRVEIKTFLDAQE